MSENLSSSSVGRSRRHCPHKLAQRLADLHALESKLQLENAHLRSKEQVLLQLLSSYSHNLHYLAWMHLQLASTASPQTRGDHQCCSSESNQNASVCGQGPTHAESIDTENWCSALVADFQAWQLLQQLDTRSNSEGTRADGSPRLLPSCLLHSSAEMSRTQRLRAAVTPEEIVAVKAASVRELVEGLKTLTRRMAQLQMASKRSVTAGGDADADADAAAPLQDSLEAALEDYGRLCTVIHMGGEEKSLEIGCLNMDSMQHEASPAGFWAGVAEELLATLKPEQIDKLCIAFEVYQEQRQVLIKKSQQTVQQLQQLQGYSAATMEAAAAAAPATAATAATAAGPAAAAAATPDIARACSSSQLAAFSLQSSCLLGLQASEKAEHLLQKLLAYTKQMREVSRHTTFHFVNTVSNEQMAAAIVASYPYWVQPVPICEHIWKQRQQVVAEQQPHVITWTAEPATECSGTYGTA